MRHLRVGRKLSRLASHRKAMLANLAMSVLSRGRVRTTVVKAKEVRRVVERHISYAKKGGLSAIRQAAKTITDKDILKKLFDEIGPGYKSREGGYIRIVKTDDRKGDNAPMCIIELVGKNNEDVQRKRKKKPAAKKPRVMKPASKPADEGAVQQEPAQPAAQAEPAEASAS